MNKILLVIAIFLALLQSSQALEITFNQNAQIDAAIIRLGDVAKCDEQSPLTEALITQTVGQAPAPGETLFLRSQTIKQHILSTNPSLPSEISWSGSPTIRVNRQGISIGADRIQTIIAEYISSNKTNLPKADIRFIPTSQPLPFTVPKGDLTYDVIPANPGILGSSSFSIIFKVDNRVVKNMSVRGKIEALAKVPVAAETLTKGLILRPQHITLVEMDISEINHPELDSRALIGMQLTKTLFAGSPILASNVETLALVKRGQKVKIIIETGALHLTATGLADADGKLEQMIRVQNINSNKTVQGRVTGPGVVEVIL